MATNECISIAGHFDGDMDALKQYMQHHLKQHVQGYWKPLDAATRQLLAQYHSSGHQANSKQNNNKNIHPLCWPF